MHRSKGTGYNNSLVNQVSNIENSTSANDEIKIKSIMLTPDEKCAVIQGHYGNFQATALPANATENLIWNSTDQNVIEIRDNDKVFAKGVGEADIIVSNAEGTITAKTSVKVYQNDNFAIETDKSKWIFNDDRLYPILWIPLKGNWDTYSCYDFSFTKSNNCLYDVCIDYLSDNQQQTYLKIVYYRYSDSDNVSSVTVGFNGKFNGSMSKDVKSISDSITIDLSIFN